MEILTVNVGSSSVKLDRFAVADGRLQHLARHRGADEQALDALPLPATVVHRVVHGGALARPALIDASVEAQIEACASLAPLHNPPALAMIRACRQRFGADVPQLAVFDTAFFADLPQVARSYALPRTLTEAHGLRRHNDAECPKPVRALFLMTILITFPNKLSVAWVHMCIV